MAAPKLLLKLRKLKAEEKSISDILENLKSQLTKLKVEELVLNSKIRSERVKETCLVPPSTKKSEGAVLPDSEEVNRESLDLKMKDDLLNKLAAGGAALLQHNYEEEEDDDDDMENDNDPCGNEVNNQDGDLRNFLIQFD